MVRLHRKSWRKEGWRVSSRYRPLTDYMLWLMRKDDHCFRDQFAMFQVSASHGVASYPPMSLRIADTLDEATSGMKATSFTARSFISMNSLARFTGSSSVIDFS